MRTNLIFKFFLVLFFIGCTTGFSFTQNRLKRKGDEHFKMLSYELAIPYYERYLKRNGEDHETQRRLADCYRLTNDYDHAAFLYDEIVIQDDAPDEAFLYYGHCLLQKNDLENAKQMFSEYNKRQPNDERGKNYLKSVDDYDLMLGDSFRVVLENLPINTKDAEFGAFPYMDGLIFASARDVGAPVRRDFNWLNTPFHSFFFSKMKEDSSGYEKPEFLKGVNTKFHESNFTMARGVSEFYFTRNNFIEKKTGSSQEGIIKLKIYKGNIEGLQVNEITEFAYNDDNYNVTHPAISPDGRYLYFVSDRPGGKGGKDIYVSYKDGSGWSLPQGVDAINTNGDEEFPFIHDDGSIYFSSDGHAGLGHLDVFRYSPASGEIRNMGAPINSASDDFAFFLDMENISGFVSSDRPGGSGSDDIYRFELMRPEVEIIVVDSLTGNTLEDVELTVWDVTKNEKESYSTGMDGSVMYYTWFERQFKIVAEKEEYNPSSVLFETKLEDRKLYYSIKVKMQAPASLVTGLVLDEETKKILPGSKLMITNNSTGESHVLITDQNGRFELELEEANDLQMDVSHNGYDPFTQFVSMSRQAFEGDTIIYLGKTSKVIVLQNFHYDYDKWKIRKDAEPALNKVGQLLMDYPDIKIELGSHTDSRGSDLYNQRLSQNRANSAKKYLVDVLGIDPERIKAVGYGEMRPAHDCTEEDCSEEEFFSNRRTELKVIGVIEGIDLEKSILETDEKNDKLPEKYVPEDEKGTSPEGGDDQDRRKT